MRGSRSRSRRRRDERRDSVEKFEDEDNTRRAERVSLGPRSSPAALWYVLADSEKAGRLMAEVRSAILGTGRAYPQGILTNADLERMVETSDEWITTRTGIKERHRASEAEYTSMFAVEASRQAIERARIDPLEIGLVICATVSPDQILPSTGCLIQAELGAHKAAAFDLAAACSGFLYGLTMADKMIKTGQIRYALVIGAEVLSRYVDFTDRSTCILFGDGAGAAIMGPAEGDRGVLATRIYSDGRFAEHLY